MATRLPSAQDLNQATPGGMRSVISADGTQVARAMQSAGNTLTAAGEQQQKKQDKFEYSRAKAYWLREQIAAESDFAEDQDYATLPDRYSTRMVDARSKAEEMVADPELRQALADDLGVDYERGFAGIKQQAKSKEKEFGRSTYQSESEQNRQALLRAPDEASRQRLLEAQRELVQSSRERNYLTPEQAQKEGVEFMHEYATQRGLTEIQADPKGALKLLKPTAAGQTGVNVSDLSQTVASKYKGVSPTYLMTTMAIETGGTFDPQAKNAKSGAAGLFQIIPSTAEHLGVKDPHDPEQAVEGGAKLASQNLVQLRKSLGRKPTDAELYLAQQQGGGGASALLKSPEENVVDALAKAYDGNKAKARAAVVQNGGNTSMTAAEFSSMWTDKYKDFEGKYGSGVKTDGVQVASLDGGMGESVKAEGSDVAYFPKTNTWADYLPYDKRIQLVNAAETQIRQDRAVNKQLLDTKVKDSTSAAMQGFPDDKPLGLSEFEDAYEPKEAELRYIEYTKAQKAATNIFKAATMTPAEQVATLLEAKPKQNGPGFADDQQNYEAMQTAISKANTLRKDDPIAFAQQYKLADDVAAQPLDTKDPAVLANQLKARGELGKTMNEKYATPLRVFTESEAASVANSLNGMIADDRLGWLNAVQGGLHDNPDAYVAAMGQLRAGSPVTAYAGTYLGLEGMYHESPWLGTKKTYTPQSVASMLLQGEDLLNPPKNSEGKEQKAVMSMPSDDKMKADFSATWGNAFASQPESANDAFMAAKAYYAALAAKEGVYDGVYDNERFADAMTAVMGNKTPVSSGNGYVTPPWGMPEDDFRDKAKLAFDTAVAQEKLRTDVWDFNDATLVGVGRPGEYAVMVGTTPMVNKQGKPVTIKVTD